MNGLQIEPVLRAEAAHLIDRHYLHRWPGVVTGVLGLRRDVLVGVIVFALPPRETFKRYGVNRAWELARLFIEDSEPANTESWFIAQAIRWIKKNRPDVQLLVSYADPGAGHSGTIYRASNWISDGRTDQERKTPRFDYCWQGKIYSRRGHVPAGVIPERVPRRSKYRFIYWMKNNEKQRQKIK